MPRIKIDLPSDFIFTTSIPVRITDLNYCNHLGNDSLLSLMHEARIQFLKHYGISEKTDENILLLQVDTAILYLAETFYGQTLQFDIAIKNISSIGFDIYYKISDEKNLVLTAKAKTSFVFYSRELKKTIKTPSYFKGIFE